MPPPTPTLPGGEGTGGGMRLAIAYGPLPNALTPLNAYDILRVSHHNESPGKSPFLWIDVGFQMPDIGQETRGLSPGTFSPIDRRRQRASRRSLLCRSPRALRHPTSEIGHLISKDTPNESPVN